MASMTTFLKNKIVNGILGIEPYIFPTEVYLALFENDPTVAGDVSLEVTNVEYDRISLAGKFDIATDDSGKTFTSVRIAFNEASIPWGTVLAIGIMTSGIKTTNDMLLFDNLPIPKTVTAGMTLEIPLGFMSLKGT